MKALVLAAGKSERLGGICGGVPKVMLPVSGTPILEHNLKYLKRQGIRDVAINVHYRPEVICRFLKRKRGLGLKIVISHEPTLLGTAGAVKKLEAWLGRKPFLVLYGDNLTDFDIRKILAAHKRSKAWVTLGVYDPLKTLWSGIAAGLIRVDARGRVRKFAERRGNPSIPSQVWVNAGVMVFSPQIFGCIPDGRFSDFGRNIFPKLLKLGKRVQVSDGARYVLASDTAEAWKITQKLFRSIKP
ncbi:MAG: nucleotidyltransferase family protein [Candidatus Omnitrophica bacterium]|nr:nucleotidyltransferase family protein [Candidatus Omnitrophota bacterium]MDD5671481.1 nucleotidyltransferase family protein [Candidatus Omnitrophota bacterium]